MKLKVLFNLFKGVNKEVDIGPEAGEFFIWGDELGPVGWIDGVSNTIGWMSEDLKKKYVTSSPPLETYEELFSDIKDRLRELASDVLHDPDLPEGQAADDIVALLDLATTVGDYAYALTTGQEDDIQEKRLVLNRCLAAAPLEQWQCPLCGEDMPDLNKAGHLMASHNAYREKWMDWRLNDDEQNVRRLKDMFNQMNVFKIKQETREAALYAGVRSMVRSAQRLIREAIRYYQEGQ